jgi:hypothetical protein
VLRCLLGCHQDKVVHGGTTQIVHYQLTRREHGWELDIDSRIQSYQVVVLWYR